MEETLYDRIDSVGEYLVTGKVGIVTEKCEDSNEFFAESFVITF